MRKPPAKVQQTFLAIEYNWKRVGGVFSSAKLAQAWCDRQTDEEPNLMWEVYPFTIDQPISDAAAAKDWRERFV